MSSTILGAAPRPKREIGRQRLASALEWLILGILCARPTCDLWVDVLWVRGRFQMNPAAFLAVALLLAGVAWLAALPPLERRQCLRSPISLLVIVWLGIYALWAVVPVAVHGASRLYGLREWARMVSFLPPVLVATHLGLQDRAERIILVLIASFGIPATSGLLQLASHGGMEIRGVHRIHGTFVHPNLFSFYLVVVLAAAYWRLRTDAHPWRWAPMIGVGLLLLYRTYSFTGMGMFSLAAVLCFVAERGRARTRSGTAIAFWIFAGIVLAFLSSFALGRTVWDRVSIDLHLQDSTSVERGWFGTLSPPPVDPDARGWSGAKPPRVVDSPQSVAAPPTAEAKVPSASTAAPAGSAATAAKDAPTGVADAGNEPNIESKPVAVPTAVAAPKEPPPAPGTDRDSPLLAGLAPWSCRACAPPPPALSAARGWTPPEQSGELGSVSMRILNWRILLSVWARQPWLGYGLEATAAVNPITNDGISGQYGLEAHNDHIRYLLETGVVGSLVYLVIFGWVGLILLRRTRSSRTEPQRLLAVVALAVFIAAFIASSNDNHSLSTAFQYCMWALVAAGGAQPRDAGAA